MPLGSRHGHKKTAGARAPAVLMIGVERVELGDGFFLLLLAALALLTLAAIGG